MSEVPLYLVLAEGGGEVGRDHVGVRLRRVQQLLQEPVPHQMPLLDPCFVLARAGIRRLVVQNLAIESGDLLPLEGLVAGWLR